MWEFCRAFVQGPGGDMAGGGARRHFFPLTSLQIGYVSCSTRGDFDFLVLGMPVLDLAVFLALEISLPVLPGNAHCGSGTATDSTEFQLLLCRGAAAVEYALSVGNRGTRCGIKGEKFIQSLIVGTVQYFVATVPNGMEAANNPELLPSSLWTARGRKLWHAILDK
jgi:hypothetical protein